MPVAAASTGSHTLLAWGFNDAGQLGNGTTTNSDVPVKVELPKGAEVTAMAAGGVHSLGLKSTGAVLAWGQNFSGQLGNGTTTSSDVPVKVDLPTGMKAVAVAAGNLHSLALTSKDSVLAWGYNEYGQLGDGTMTDSDVPVKVKLPKGTKVRAVAAGDFDSLGLTSTGAVLAWGSGDFGELGDGSTKGSDAPVKVKLPKGVKVVAIAAGGYDNLALTSTGQVLAWGNNGQDELGDGKSADSDVPVEVKLPKRIKVTALAGGYGHSLALTSTGSVLAWGDNYYGELGVGKAVGSSAVPLKVKLPKGIKVTEIAAGTDHSLALTSRGSLLAWGQGKYGQLGNGNTTKRWLPVKVDLPTGTIATAVNAGPLASHSLALVHNA